jgi:glycosyltransferase involved in cell wall biosynthesis
MSAKVSIVLPNYNYARYLDKRITSLLNQTFRDFELIIVDDASSDNSWAVISKYRSDPRVRTFRFETNSGEVYRRWNDGAKFATGDYLLFAGADDYCAPDFLETLVGVLDAHPGVGIAFSRSKEIDSTGNLIGLKPPEMRWSTDFIVTGAEEAPFLFAKLTIPTASATLLRRSVFERCGGFDTSFRLAADHMLWARMLQISHLGYIAEPLNYFRRHDNTASRRLARDVVILETYRVVDFMLSAFDISEEARQRGLNKLAIRWIKRIAAMRSVADLEIDRVIYQSARAIDPRIFFRLLRAACVLLASTIAHKMRSICRSICARNDEQVSRVRSKDQSRRNTVRSILSRPWQEVAGSQQAEQKQCLQRRSGAKAYLRLQAKDDTCDKKGATTHGK